MRMLGGQGAEAGCAYSGDEIRINSEDDSKSGDANQPLQGCTSLDVFPAGEDSFSELLPTPTGEDMNEQLTPNLRKHISLPLSCSKVHENRRRRSSFFVPHIRCSQRRTLPRRSVNHRMILALLSLLLCLPAACDCLSTECQHTPVLVAKIPSMGLRPEQEPSQSSQLYEHITAVEQHLESMQSLIDSQSTNQKEAAKLHAALQRADKCKDLLESVTQSSCFQNCQDLNRENMKSCSFRTSIPDESNQKETADILNNFIGEPSEVVTEAICSAAFTGDLRTISALIESGQASVNTCDYDKRSILHRAVVFGHAEVVKYLLEKGADKNHKDRGGASAFGDAVKSKDEGIRSMLRGKRARAEEEEEEEEEGRGLEEGEGEGGGEDASSQRTQLMRRARNEHWAVHRNEVKILKLIGEGDQGLVYKAEWRGMPVVCKMLKNKDQTRTPEEQLKEFANEISVLAILRHPNLVLFLGACLDWEPNFILTELVEGGALIDVFERAQQMAENSATLFLPTTTQVVVWATDLARALCCLHEQQPPVIHRDVKPSNLLITQDKHLKLSDLGLSKVVEREGEAGPYRMTGATGTLRWMAPEVVRSENYDAKVDVYSFGFVLWYMCTGELPLAGISQADLVQAAYDGRDLRPDVSRIQCEQLAELMQRCWARLPKHRPTAHDVLEELAMISPFDPSVTAAKPPP